MINKGEAKVRSVKNKPIKSEESLYIRILIWAYERQDMGFTWEDLTSRFRLNDKQLQWVQKIFRSNLPVSENLIDHLNYQDSVNSFVITTKGTSAAVQYLNLKEAQKSGKRAEYIAWVAISSAIIVGITQIVIGLMQLRCN